MTLPLRAPSSGSNEAWGAGRLPADAEALADELHPWVRAKFLELWQLAQVPDPFS
jgi:hypothetical protein